MYHAPAPKFEYGRVELVIIYRAPNNNAGERNVRPRASASIRQIAHSIRQAYRLSGQLPHQNFNCHAALYDPALDLSQTRTTFAYVFPVAFLRFKAALFLSCFGPIPSPSSDSQAIAHKADCLARNSEPQAAGYLAQFWPRGEFGQKSRIDSVPSHCSLPPS